MYSNVGDFIEFLNKYKVNEHQALILHLVDSGDFSNMQNYREKIGKFNKEDVQDLLDRGLVIQKGELLFTNMEINMDSKESEWFKEIFDIYPNQLLINNSPISAKGVNFEDISKYYYNKVIKGNKKKHEQLLTQLKEYFKNTKYAKMGIKKFLESREYERLTAGESRTTERFT